MFKLGTCTFELYFSKAKRCYLVRVASPDDSGEWDYDDVELARDMSHDVRRCLSYEEALYSLGLLG